MGYSLETETLYSCIEENSDEHVTFLFLSLCVLQNYIIKSVLRDYQEDISKTSNAKAQLDVAPLIGCRR